MAESVEVLLKLLDLEQIEVDLFRGESPATSMQRVFGGQVAAQALCAAGQTVGSDRFVHSMHAYFLRPGDPETPIVYTVDRAREGRTFSTRRVLGTQHGKSIFSMSASFQPYEFGLDHGDPMPDAPDPLSLPTLSDRLADDPAAWSDYYREWACFDFRTVAGPRDALPPLHGQATRSQVWFRANSMVPAEPLIQACALAYASDLTLLAATLVPHSVVTTDPRLQIASLDHALWFHRPFTVDDWMLYEQSSPSASGGRGLASGRIFTRAGDLVATVMQEGLIRMRG